MSRCIYGAETTWKDAAKYLAESKDNAVARKYWYNSGGILYVYQNNAGDLDDKGNPAEPHYVCLRDFNPTVPLGIWHNYVVNYDWKPSHDELEATDWRRYGTEDY